MSSAVQKPVSRSHSQRTPRSRGDRVTRTRRRSHDSPDRTEDPAVIAVAPSRAPGVVVPQQHAENGGLPSPMLRRREPRHPRHQPEDDVVTSSRLVSGHQNGVLESISTGSRDAGGGKKTIRRFEVLSKEAQAHRTKYLKQKYAMDELEIKNTLGTIQLPILPLALGVYSSSLVCCFSITK